MVVYSARISNDVATVRTTVSSGRLSDHSTPSSLHNQSGTARWAQRKLNQRRKELTVLLCLVLLCFAWQWASDIMFQVTAFFDAINMEQLLVLPCSLHWGTTLCACVTFLSYDSARTLARWLTPWSVSKSTGARWERISSACAVAFVLLTLLLSYRH